MDRRLIFRPRWQMLFCQVRRLVSLPSIGWGITAITKGSDEVLDRSDKTYTAWKSLTVVCRRPYRKPTQVGEESILRRAREPTLRNSAISPRNFGRRGALLSCTPSRWKRERAAENRFKRLFTKNIGLCEAVRRRIGADACPMPEC
jgi:hypothetical protein